MSIVIVDVDDVDDDVAKTCSFAATYELMIAAKVGSRWKKMVIEDRRSKIDIGGALLVHWVVYLAYRVLILAMHVCENPPSSYELQAISICSVD